MRCICIQHLCFTQNCGTVSQFWSWIALYLVLIRKGWEQPIKLLNLFFLIWWVFSKPCILDVSQLRSKAVGFVSCPVQATLVNSYSAINTYIHFFCFPSAAGSLIPELPRRNPNHLFQISYAVCYAHLLFFFIANSDIFFPSYLLSCSRFQFSCSLTPTM